MPRITEQRQKSDVRVATVRAEVTRAIQGLAESDPDLTYEEIIEAMADVTGRFAQHLRAAEADDG